MTNKEVFFNISVAKRVRTMHEPIMWMVENKEGVLYPHEDELVIKATVTSKKFDRILVDTGSSVDVMFKSTLYEIGITYLRIEHTNTSLKGFSEGRLTPLDVVEISSTIGSAPSEKTMILNFVLVDEESPYQIILGRPFLRVSKPVLSNRYLTLKYRVNGVFGVIRGDQRIVRGCYSTAEKEAMQITSLDTHIEFKGGRQESVEELETVNLEQGDSRKIVRIRSKLKKKLKQELVHCLRSHADVFTWTHDDILGIDLEVACHRLVIKKVPDL